MHCKCYLAYKKRVEQLGPMDIAKALPHKNTGLTPHTIQTMRCFHFRGVGEGGGRLLTPHTLYTMQVRTTRGDTISSRAVVHCTNAYSSMLLPELQGKLVPVRNQVCVCVCICNSVRV